MSTKMIGINSIWTENESSLDSRAARRDYSVFILRRISRRSRTRPIGSSGELDAAPVAAPKCLAIRREAQYSAPGARRFQKTIIIRKILINSSLCIGDRSIQPEYRPVKPVAWQVWKERASGRPGTAEGGHSQYRSGAKRNSLAH